MKWILINIFLYCSCSLSQFYVYFQKLSIIFVCYIFIVYEGISILIKVRHKLATSLEVILKMLDQDQSVCTHILSPHHTCPCCSHCWRVTTVKGPRWMRCMPVYACVCVYVCGGDVQFAPVPEPTRQRRREFAGASAAFSTRPEVLTPFAGRSCAGASAAQVKLPNPFVRNHLLYLLISILTILTKNFSLPNIH